MYIQKMVPPYSSMLYLRPNYDVISYRIEHVKTNEKAELSREEAEALGLSAKDTKKYKIGMRYEPFIRIYRTIAPHASVEKFVKNGGNLLEAFKKPSLIPDAKEEVCFSTTFAAINGTFLDFSRKLSESGTLFTDFLDYINDEDRRKFKISARSKNVSIISFKRKCLAIDDFFEKESKYLEDPQMCHEDKILNDSIKDLSRIFNECENLDKYTPAGFAEATSIFDQYTLIELFTVIKLLKWQVGLEKNLNDKIFSQPFRTENTLWYRNTLTSYAYYTSYGYYTGRGDVSEVDFFAEKSMFDSFYDDTAQFMKTNPHKMENYKINKMEGHGSSAIEAVINDMGEDEEALPMSKKKKFFQIKFEPAFKILDRLTPDDEVVYLYWDPVKIGTIKSYWTGKMPEQTKKILRDITIKDDIIRDDEKFRPTLRQKVKMFYKDFVEGILKRDIDQYPTFIKELLNDREKYMGNLIYAYYDEDGNVRSPQELKVKDLGFEGYFSTIAIDDIDYGFIFDFAVEENALQNVPEFIFNILYLSDYSDVMKLAHKCEQSKLSVYESLQKIKALDPSDTIAERFLACFVYKELEKLQAKFIDKWDKFLGESTFSTLNTQEERALEAFKIYRKTMQSIVSMLEKANEFDPIVSFNKDPDKLPSLYSSVRNFILDKLFSDSLVLLNREFNRDAIKTDMNIVEYVSSENEKARIVRNKFAHGMDINKEEYLQFDNFCRRIKRLSDSLKKNYIKKIESD